MFLKDRPAIGRVALAILIIFVVVVGGAIGISYPKPKQSAPATSTTTTTPSSTAISSSSAATSSIPTISTSSTTTSAPSSSSSAVSSTTVAPSLKPSDPLFHFVLNSLPNRILLAPGANLTYATLSVVPLPSSHEAAGQPLESGDELVVLNATVPSGLSLRFFGSNLVNKEYVEVSLVGALTVSLNLAAAKDAAPGDYTITIVAASGNFSSNLSFTVRVAQYLVIAYLNSFSPANFTIKVGSTVYWLNLGGNGGPENYYDVVFQTIKVQSPTMDGNLFDSYSYTFTAAGSYPYYSDTVGQIMSGNIIVTN
ncbi:MAG: hypothetical protein OK455_06025 [Thaumarchaeota archaeon]|nr:hypothetical protein [Nitrososphaerota archaeon]